jgi:hypothetical protein
MIDEQSKTNSKNSQPSVTTVASVRAFLFRPLKAATQDTKLKTQNFPTVVDQSRDTVLEAGIARGLVARKELELAEGGSISTDEMARKMGVQRQAIDHKRKQNHLTAWRDAQGHWRFPLWQIDPKTGKPLKGVKGCLEVLPEDEWSRMLFFLSRNAGLPGQRRPLDLLRAEEIAPVLVAALRYGRHGN